MLNISVKQIKVKVKELYKTQGQGASFDWIGQYISNNRVSNPIRYERCEACDTSSPSIEHECLICGQETHEQKPIFYQAVLKKVSGNIFEHVYPHIENAAKEFDLDERLGNGGCCSECGGNKWMLLAKESVAVTQGGKPYIECLDCGSTTHL